MHSKYSCKQALSDSLHLAEPVFNHNNIRRRQRALWLPAANNACEHIPQSPEPPSQAVCNIFHYLHMTLLLLLYFWVEHGFILCEVKGKTKALFNLMMTVYFLILSLELRSSKPVCQNPSEAGEEGGLKHTWCWIHQCGSFLVVNYAVHLCICVCVCVSACECLEESYVIHSGNNYIQPSGRKGFSSVRWWE